VPGSHLAIAPVAIGAGKAYPSVCGAASPTFGITNTVTSAVAMATRVTPQRATGHEITRFGDDFMSFYGARAINRCSETREISFRVAQFSLEFFVALHEKSVGVGHGAPVQKRRRMRQRALRRS
jgi:hypothetical protein